ncbi:hypothetical protein AB0F20_29880 [Streptomyces goshikiensis]|uniref:DUF6907 domain-containing protein n=1 Tax=Streptomyces goshikiensis TaxID=1942 RepID=UPI0033FD4055
MWKASVTGENCPTWCTADHSEVNARRDAIIHSSGPAVVQFPPMINGRVLTAAFTTCAAEDFEGLQRRTRIDFEMHDEKDEANLLPDYVPVRTRAELDDLLAGLDRVAEQLRTWRDRLPEAP